MAIKPYQAIATPVGHFDVLDIDSATIKGGEVLVFDRVDGNDVEYATQDVLANDGYRAQMRLAGPLDVGPFFLAANEDRPSSNTGFENTNLYGTNAAYSQTIDGSGKASLFADNGFYAISSDVIDTDTITINTPVYTKLYPDANGYLTTTPNLTDECVGFFIEYQLGSALRGRPGSLYYPGTHKTGDTLIVYKSSGYPSADEDGDGYEDGYVWADQVRLASAYPFVSSDNLEEAIEEISDSLVAGLGRPEYLNPTGTITIYVRETGDDGYGDGTLVNPYRQPERAARDIPLNAVGVFFIQCGAGTFDMPVVPHYGSGTGALKIIFIGDRSNPEVDLSGNPAQTLVAGKFCQWSSTVPAYTATVGDATHWVYRSPFNATRSPRAYVSLASTSPNFRLVSDAITSTLMVAAYPFATTFNIAQQQRSFVYTQAPWNINTATDPTQVSVVTFCGLQFSKTTASICTIEGADFEGCRFLSVLDLFKSPAVRAAFDLGIRVCDSQLPGSFLLSGNLSVSNNVLISGVVTRSSSTLGHITSSVTNRAMLCFSSSSGTVGGWDCEGTGLGLVLSNGSAVYWSGNLSVTGSPTNFMALSNNSTFLKSGLTRAVTGSTNGVCVTLESGSQATGLETLFSTFLTNSAVPGDEIQIGSTTTPADAFADLPISDAASFCRAT